MVLKNQAVKSFKWQVGVNLVQKVISVGVTVILARFLGPSVFGFFSLTMIVVTSFEMFKSLGIDAALIRKQQDFSIAANTAFFIIAILGVVLYILLNLSANILAQFFNNLELSGVVRVLGFNFVFTALSRVPTIILEKNMQYEKISIIEFIGGVIFSAFALIFAFHNFGVWSLVYASLLQNLVYMVLIFVFSKYLPNPEFSKKIAWEMLHFGKFIFLSSILWFMKVNLNNMFIGKILGVLALGLYGIAFSFSNLVGEYIGIKVNRVSLPLYSSLQDDRIALKNSFFKITKYLGIITIPFGLSLFFMSRDVLSFLFGNKWLGAVDILKVLALGNIFNTFLYAGFESIFIACGRPKLIFFATLFQVTSFLCLVVPVAKVWGLLGVGFLVSLTNMVAFTIELILIKRILLFKYSEFLFSLKPAFLSSLVMGCYILIFKTITSQLLTFEAISHNFIFLMLSTVCVFFLTIIKFESGILKEIKLLILK